MRLVVWYFILFITSLVHLQLTRDEKFNYTFYGDYKEVCNTAYILIVTIHTYLYFKKLKLFELIEFNLFKFATVEITFNYSE